MLFKSAYDNIKHYINYYYFTQGNYFTGSLDNEFCYRIEPDKENDALKVYTYSHCCFEKADNKECQDFEFSEEGLDAAVKWICSKYNDYIQK